ncbi:MAG TPA: TetR/AcrR family transcriptional regulator [Chloroflexota bacterium]|jgi:AcrR family transcriptional regulator
MTDRKWNVKSKIWYAARMDSTPRLTRTKLTPKGEQTRQRIVAAAALLMFERGVASTTIEDVKSAANVSSSQLYHYFSDKDALVRAVIERQTDTIVGGAEATWGNLDSLQGLRAWRDFVVDIEHQRCCIGGCPLGSLGSALAEIDSPARAQIAVSFNRWAAAIQGGLRTMHARGQLIPEANPDDVALATLAALEGGLLLSQIQRTTQPLETALDAMLTLIGFLTTPAPALQGKAAEEAP